MPSAGPLLNVIIVIIIDDMELCQVIFSFPSGMIFKALKCRKSDYRPGGDDLPYFFPVNALFYPDLANRFR